MILPYPSRNFWPELVLLLLITGSEVVRIFLGELSYRNAIDNRGYEEVSTIYGNALLWQPSFIWLHFSFVCWLLI